MKTLTTYNPSPGEILKEEFLEPAGITQYRLAKETGIPESRLSEIIRGRRSVTMDTAIRLGRYFSQSPLFWMNLQNTHDMAEAEASGEVRKVEEAVTPYQGSISKD